MLFKIMLPKKEKRDANERKNKDTSPNRPQNLEVRLI